MHLPKEVMTYCPRCHKHTPHDVEKAKKVAGRIDAGTVWVNEYHLLSAAAPRGGFKKSGIGRELGVEGMMEFTQTRHIFVSENADIDEVAYGLVLPE
ncbi:MAG: aldehyde dehydrogenase family protein [Nitrososphaerota archaeon]|nr:aldehyde dehydrogenase family protein [Nitrososphaerota archaeon]